MIKTLFKTALVLGAIGLGLDLLKKSEDAKKEAQPKLPLLRDRDLPAHDVELPAVINLDHHSQTDSEEKK